MLNEERNEISLHEVQVWRELERHPGRWLTSREICAALSGAVAPRTVRAHAAKLTALGLLDVAEVFPGHRYRLSEKASQRNPSYVRRLRYAAEVFGR